MPLARILVVAVAVYAAACDREYNREAGAAGVQPTLAWQTGLAPVSDQPWDLMTGLGWNYLRRTSSKDDSIFVDSTAPFSPLNTLRIVFTTDMVHDTEPSVHWISIPSLNELYTGWWMKVSPNWSCSPAGCGKITFLMTNGGGQVYTNLYHN